MKPNKLLIDLHDCLSKRFKDKPMMQLDSINRATIIFDKITKEESIEVAEEWARKKINTTD